MNKKEFFYQQVAKKGIEVTEAMKAQFETYAKLLVEWNQKMNLTAIVDEQGIYEKHFLDSFLLAYAVEIKGSLCDVGAGAGFPSVPCLILYPELQVTIVEPLQKRCTFLQEVKQQLGLHNLRIANARAEDFAKDHRESFDIVTARAVANLTMLSELCLPLVKKGGFFVALKGPGADDELQEAAFAIKTLRGQVERIDHQEFFDQQRNNLIIKKVDSTPKKYPRAFAQIKKNPLRRKA